MLAVNLGIATLIPICWVLMAVVHQVRPRWLSLGAAQDPLALSDRLPGDRAGGAERRDCCSRWRSSRPLRFGPQPGFWGFLVVIVLTSPLQAVAEEIFFRGYLMQALGSLVRPPWFGVVVSAVLFALLHGLQNPALFVDRLAFGLLAGLLVWRTGGLEAGIAAHVVNNVCAYVIAGLTTSIAALQGDQRDQLARRRLRRRRVRPVRRAGVRCCRPAAEAADPGRSVAAVAERSGTGGRPVWGACRRPAVKSSPRAPTPGATPRRQRRRWGIG